MDRRKFIVTSGTGIGLGIAGCLEATDGDESGGDGDDDTDADALESTDGGERSNETENGNESGDRSGETNGENGGNDTDENGSDETGDGNESDDESGSDEVEDDEAGTRAVNFASCARVEVTGTFEDGDVAFASTGFYAEAGYGNTLLEDGVTFGTDVDAPFTGAVIFETGNESAVREEGDEVVVEIADHTDDGVVITGITTEREDYVAGGITHENPHAEECLAERAPDDAAEDSASDERNPEGENGSDSDDQNSDGEDGSGTDEQPSDTDEQETDGGEQDSSGGPPAFSVSITGTNAPVDGGDYLEITAELENTGGDGSEDVRLVVGHASETVETQSVTLDAGEKTTITKGYQTPPVRAEQEVPVRIETETDAAERTVSVNGV